jgi:hypothetical protein
MMKTMTLDLVSFSFVFRDIEDGFEFIKKNWMNNKNFPIAFSGPNLKRTFTPQELINRHKHGRLTPIELIQIRNEFGKRRLIGLESDKDFNEALREAGIDVGKYAIRPTKDEIIALPITPHTQNAGREGFAGPSELGVIPAGQFLAHHSSWRRLLLCTSYY